MTLYDIRINYNPNVDLFNINVYRKFIKFCPFILKKNSKNQILTSIKGPNSVAILRKTMIYNPNLDLVNDNVYTKFGLILSNHSQEIEQKTHSDINQGL